MKNLRTNLIRWLAAALCIFSLELGALPSVWKLNSGRSSITFSLRSKTKTIEGKFTRFTLENFSIQDNRPESAQGKLVIDMRSINTALAARDNVLRSRDFFDTNRFAHATAAIYNVTIVDDLYLAHISLQIRGITKDVVVPMLVTIENNSLIATGKTSINRKEFGISGDYKPDPIEDDTIVVEVILSLEK